MAAHAPRVTVDAAAVSLPPGHPARRFASVAAIAGVVLVAAAAVVGGDRFYSAYLLAYLFFLTIALGGLFFVLVQFATRAGWSVTVRRLAEHTAATLPLFALLFVPLLFGLGELYHWSHPEEVAADPLLIAKSGFLNLPFFYVRAAFYLGTWGLLGWWFRRRSLAQDLSGDPLITRRLQSISAPALIVFALTSTFASFDWVMSLDPHWYSTIFGVYLFSGMVVAILSVLVLLSVGFTRPGGPLTGLVTAEHLHDLGKLLFGFVVFWAYIGFSQYMLIWYGDIPEETVFYATRLDTAWEGLTWALALGHFVVPFFFLLGRDTKRRRLTAAAASLWLLAFHYLDLYWLVMPALSPAGPAGGVLVDLLAFLGVGGLFVGALAFLAARPALVPVGDPRLSESLAFENM